MKFEKNIKKLAISCYGITNYHVYERYKIEKNDNKHTICQIGHQYKIRLEDKIVHVDKDNDLIIFDLNDDYLNKMSTTECQKTGFDSIDTDIAEYLQGQDERDPATWWLHFVGCPGAYKETIQISNMEYHENFIIDLYHAPGEYVDEIKKLS